MYKTKGPLAGRIYLFVCWFNISVEHVPKVELLHALSQKERCDLYLVLFLSNCIVFFNASGPLF